MKTITSSPHTSRPEPPSFRLRDSPCQDWRVLCCSVCPQHRHIERSPPRPEEEAGSCACLLLFGQTFLRATGRFSQCCFGLEGNRRWGLIKDWLKSWTSGQLLQGYYSQLPAHSLSVGSWVLAAYPSAVFDGMATWEQRPSLFSVIWVCILVLGRPLNGTESASDLCSSQVPRYLSLQRWVPHG